ncbi:hypothetical protein [Epilithonimonas sp.]|uniref:hypothetical protein n=1 Tax=Epilithonimonas sp. TaxID=2894511 RepID=UPI002FDD0EA7
MTTKILVFGFLLILISCSEFNAQKNPDYICKDCGSFDLSKMTFNENISDLASKTEVWKTVIVNANNEEKQVEELQKSDIVKFYKYHFSNQRELILGKKPFNYNNQFFFNGLVILTDAKNKIYGYEAINFFDGKMSEISNFVSYLKKENSSSGYKLNKMYGDLSVHQWISNKKIVQLVNDNKVGTEERTVNGEKTVVKSTYIKLNVYSESFIKNSVEKSLEKDLDFAVYNQKHFQK